MRTHRAIPIVVAVAATFSAFEPAARACEPSVDESTMVSEGLGDTQAHRVERVPRNYAYVDNASYADGSDSQPPGRASLRSGTLQLQDWGCDSTTNSLALELGAEVVDDQTPPGEITYAIFAGARRARRGVTARPRIPRRRGTSLRRSF